MHSKIDQGLLNLDCTISLPITMAGGFETRPYIPIDSPPEDVQQNWKLLADFCNYEFVFWYYLEFRISIFGFSWLLILESWLFHPKEVTKSPWQLSNNPSYNSIIVLSAYVKRFVMPAVAVGSTGLLGAPLLSDQQTVMNSRGTC
jgi:hypothetical protein